MTVSEMFEQFLLARESAAFTEQDLKLAFFAGAKCIVALASEALAPQYQGDQYHIKSMALTLNQVDTETTAFFRNPEPPAPEEEKMVTLN